MEFFDFQFSSRQQIYAKEGVIEYVDIFPEEASDNLPILLACGWGESLESIKETLRALHGANRRVIAIDPARVDNIHGVQSVFPVDSYIKGMAYLRLLDKLNIAKVDVVAHSEGAINALVAVAIDNKYFQRLILVAPAGMVEHDKILQLVKRFVGDFLRIAQKGFLGKNDHMRFERIYVKSVLRYFFMNPIQSLREAFVLPYVHLDGLLVRAHNQSIPIYLLFGEKDSVFPLEKMKETSLHIPVESIEVFDGYHSTIHIFPEMIIPFIKKYSE